MDRTLCGNPSVDMNSSSYFDIWEAGACQLSLEDIQGISPNILLDIGIGSLTKATPRTQRQRSFASSGAEPSPSMGFTMAYSTAPTWVHIKVFVRVNSLFVLASE